MKYSQAKQGRIFIIRLEDGEILHETIENFATEQGIQAAYMIVLGGADSKSRLVVGPLDGQASPVIPMIHELGDVHEIVGTGTLFPDEEGKTDPAYACRRGTPGFHHNRLCPHGRQDLAGGRGCFDRAP